MIDIQNKPQVVVIGGGPAGTTVATLLAQQGVRVELFEREKFPRFHIGESLIPETYWVLKRLNMLPKLKDSQFIKKYSVQFVSDSGKQSAPFYFHDNKDHDCSQTWQVRRSEFDEMMLRNAEEHGVTTHEGVRVLDVLFDGDRATGIQIMDESGEKRDIFADVVVDASGQSSMLINKLKLRVPDPSLNKGSIWTYYKGAKRDPGRDEGATTVLQVENKQGWFWYIPLHDDMVSIGVVGDFDYLFKGRGSHEQVFAEELEKCPAAKMRVEGAEQVTKIYATKDFTYKSKQAAGNGWVLIGDALGFLDPLYSSGVLLALKSGELAADAIVEGLKKGDTSREQLGHWEKDYLVGMERMRKLVCEYYDGFNFGRFVRRFPDHRGDITDLLIGDLFKDSLDKVFESIATMKSESEAMAE